MNLSEKTRQILRLKGIMWWKELYNMQRFNLDDIPINRGKKTKEQTTFKFYWNMHKFWHNYTINTQFLNFLIAKTNFVCGITVHLYCCIIVLLLCHRQQNISQHFTLLSHVSNSHLWLFNFVPCEYVAILTVII